MKVDALTKGNVKVSESSQSDSLKVTGVILRDLHEVWKPHAGQIPVGKKMFYDGSRWVFIECGRKWGKTEWCTYLLYRMALLKPGGQFYYVAPFYNQAAEIIWEPRRLQDFLGPYRDKYVAKVRDSDRRIILHNGSFIKLVGSDNFEAGRGFNPDGAIYDEFKDHDIRFDKGFRPNLITKKGWLCIVGTPPDADDQHFFFKTADDFAQRSRGAYFNMPTHTNPHIDPEELKEDEEAYRKRGEYADFQREYLAMRVRGGAGTIFPMFQPAKVDHLSGVIKEYSNHVVKDEEIMEKIRRYPKDYDFYGCFDPGTTSCFAFLAIAIHKYTKEIYCLREIYETDANEASTLQIFPRAMRIIEEIHGHLDRWTLIYDNAAAWFATEVAYHYGSAILPCDKDLKNKENKISLIKDCLLQNFLVMSEKCPKLAWEMLNYAKDENGKIPKKNDHLLDCLRYIYNAAAYDVLPRKRKLDPRVERDHRILPVDSELDPRAIIDPYEDIYREYYD